MFNLGPLLGRTWEHHKYAPLLWDSLNCSIYVSVVNARCFHVASHYCFGTDRYWNEVTSDEMEDVTVAMQIACEAFLHRFDVIEMQSSGEDLRTVLSRSPKSFPEWVWRERAQRAEAVREEVAQGNLVFVPTHAALRACVEAVREDRHKQSAYGAQQPQNRNPHATAHQMMGKAPRVAQNLAESTSLADAQSFEYQPGSLLDQEQDQEQEVAGTFLTPADEAECELQYDLDMAECSAYAAMDKRYWGVCKERAMQRYSNCLGGRFVG